MAWCCAVHLVCSHSFSVTILSWLGSLLFTLDYMAKSFCTFDNDIPYVGLPRTVITKFEAHNCWPRQQNCCGPDLTHTWHFHLAHIPCGTMALGRSAPVCQMWATGKPYQCHMLSNNKTNKAEPAQIWATVHFNSGPDLTPFSGPRTAWNDGTWAVCSFLPDLGHKQAIAMLHISHTNTSTHTHWTTVQK